jgi:hypothetical protein
MAEPPLSHNGSVVQDYNAITPFDGTGVLPRLYPQEVVLMGLASSSTNRVQNDGSAYAPISLPLRQAFKQPVAQTKIHDITEKFTRACNGKFIFFLCEVPTFGMDILIRLQSYTSTEFIHVLSLPVLVVC